MSQKSDIENFILNIVESLGAVGFDKPEQITKDLEKKVSEVSASLASRCKLDKYRGQRNLDVASALSRFTVVLGLFEGLQVELVTLSRTKGETISQTRSHVLGDIWGRTQAAKSFLSRMVDAVEKGAYPVGEVPSDLEMMRDALVEVRDLLLAEMGNLAIVGRCGSLFDWATNAISSTDIGDLSGAISERLVDIAS